MGLQPTLWQRCCGEKGQEANFGKKVSRPSDQPDLRYKGQSGWKLPGSPMVKTWPSGSNPGQESRIPPTSRTEQQKKKKKKKKKKAEKDPWSVSGSSGTDVNVIHLSGKHSWVQIWGVRRSSFDTDLEEHVRIIFFQQTFLRAHIKVIKDKT